MIGIIVELELDETNGTFLGGEYSGDPEGYILAELGWVEASGIFVRRILDPES